jgi:hypothetical protein
MARWKRLIFVATDHRTPDEFKEEICSEAKRRKIEDQVIIHTYGKGKSMFTVDTCNEGFASHM